jgi:hypothetical protein
VTNASMVDGRSGQISVVNVASVAGDLKGVAPAWCSASNAVALGPRIRANAVASCNDLLRRRISTGAQEQGGGYAIGPSR